MAIFDEKYRVVALENQRLVIRGERSGEVLVINADAPCGVECSSIRA